MILKRPWIGSGPNGPFDAGAPKDADLAALYPPAVPEYSRGTHAARAPFSLADVVEDQPRDLNLPLSCVPLCEFGTISDAVGYGSGVSDLNFLHDGVN